MTETELHELVKEWLAAMREDPIMLVQLVQAASRRAASVERAKLRHLDSAK